MSPVYFLRRSSHLSIALGAGLVAVVATLALTSSRVRLADARVAHAPAVASPPSSAPLCAGLPPALPLGLANGDTLRAINGLPLTSADRALEAYSRLRATDLLTLELTRRGQPLTLTYEIVD